MATSSILLLCLLVTSSVWTVQSRNVKVRTDDDHDDQAELSVESNSNVKLPGVCWACKWALNKVKKMLGKNSTAETIKAKLSSVCDKISIVKSLCLKFVKSHLSILVDELMTNDGVLTICIKAKACKKKELKELFQSDIVPQMEIKKYA